MVQAEVEAAKVALEQAEMSAVMAATECMNMQKVGTDASHAQAHHHCRCLAMYHQNLTSRANHQTSVQNRSREVQHKLLY